MPSWNNVEIQSQGDQKLMLKQFEIELNRRLRYYLANIDTSQVTSGTITLAKGGTGASLVAPVTDKILFYDSSGNSVTWLSIGSGLTITGDTITASAVSLGVVTKTGTSTLTIGEAGQILCNSSSNFTLNLPTTIGNQGLTYTITNINTGIVTIDPFGSEDIHGETTFDLYEKENLKITSSGSSWYLS